MTDIFSKEKRSELMQKVRRKNTPQEILVRKFLFSENFRFRNNVKKLPGSPDIVLPKYKVAIFIHGCFWHGHSCKAGNLPKSNIDFWIQKIDSNKKRDKRNKYHLKKLGWHIIIIWECNLKQKNNMEKSLLKLSEKLQFYKANNYYPS